MSDKMKYKLLLCGARDYSVNTAELLLDASTRSPTDGQTMSPKLVSSELLCDRKDHSL